MEVWGEEKPSALPSGFSVSLCPWAATFLSALSAPTLQKTGLLFCEGDGDTANRSQRNGLDYILYRLYCGILVSNLILFIL